MKILGIGNAIVDVICKVENSFITNNGLTKRVLFLSSSANSVNYIWHTNMDPIMILKKPAILNLAYKDEHSI